MSMRNVRQSVCVGGRIKLKMKLKDDDESKINEENKSCCHGLTKVIVGTACCCIVSGSAWRLTRYPEMGHHLTGTVRPGLRRQV